MKTYATTVTERGQVSIPADLRKSMALDAGQKLVWEKISDEEVRIHVLKDKPDPLSMLGYGPKVRGEPARTTDAWMRELREGEQD
jgi:AbrB family looped-hinge helix DNA binding protein